MSDKHSCNLKYKQVKGKSIYNSHKFADGKHYHWKCVLRNLDSKTIEQIKQRGNKAIKTHIPYYSGFEGLLRKTDYRITILEQKIFAMEEILKDKDDGEEKFSS